jgi:hypothetical protein
VVPPDWNFDRFNRCLLGKIGCLSPFIAAELGACHHLLRFIIFSLNRARDVKYGSVEYCVETNSQTNASQKVLVSLQDRACTGMHDN